MNLLYRLSFLFNSPPHFSFGFAGGTGKDPGGGGATRIKDKGFPTRNQQQFLLSTSETYTSSSSSHHHHHHLHNKSNNQDGWSRSRSEHISKLALVHPLCKTNVTVYAGQSARMYCCLARTDRNLNVSSFENIVLKELNSRLIQNIIIIK